MVKLFSGVRHTTYESQKQTFIILCFMIVGHTKVRNALGADRNIIRGYRGNDVLTHFVGFHYNH
jgi:hypothetical protein